MIRHSCLATGSTGCLPATTSRIIVRVSTTQLGYRLQRMSLRVRRWTVLHFGTPNIHQQADSATKWCAYCNQPFICFFSTTLQNSHKEPTLLTARVRSCCDSYDPSATWSNSSTRADYLVYGQCIPLLDNAWNLPSLFRHLCKWATHNAFCAAHCPGMLRLRLVMRVQLVILQHARKTRPSTGTGRTFHCRLLYVRRTYQLRARWPTASATRSCQTLKITTTLTPLAVNPVSFHPPSPRSYHRSHLRHCSSKTIVTSFCISRPRKTHAPR